MKMRVTLIVPALFAAATLVSVAQAQTADKPATSAPEKSTAMPQRPRLSADALQRMQDGRMAMVRATLKMTDAQLKLWSPVEDLIRARQTQRMQAMQDRVANPANGSGSPSLADRLDRMSAQTAKRAEGSKAFAAAFRPFYESLSESQKAVAGPLLADLEGGRHMQGRRWAGHGGRGMSQQ